MTETEEPLSNVSDSSFIILGKGSLPPSIDNETEEEFLSKHSIAFIESNKLLSDRNTPCRSSDGHNAWEEDIQGKLKQLVQENNQLKETLSQNNLAIKSQLDTFYMWQQEVLKTHETHKQKFLETRDLILKLRAENLSLKKKLDEDLGTIVDDTYAQINKKQNVGELKQKDDLSSKNEILEMENMKLREKLKATEDEVLKLNKELEDVLRENKFLKQKRDEKSSLGSLSHGSLPNSEARAQISNIFKQLEIERNTVSKLKEKLKTANDIISKMENVSLGEEVNEYIKNIDDMTLSFDHQSQRFSSLQSWVKLAEENIKDEGNHNLMGEIKELKCHISQEEKTTKQKQENLQELKDQFNRLLEDYKTLQQQLSSIKNKDVEVEKYVDAISNLSLQLQDKNEEVLLKQQECDRLKEEIKKLNLECEEVAILKVQSKDRIIEQMELYQSDFQDERAARERVVGEKEKMAEQLRLLQSRLEALQEERKTEMQKPNEVERNTEEEDENRSDENDTQESKSFFRPYKGSKSNFICPKCMFSYRDLKTCEEHVKECLNFHFYP